MFSRKRHFYEKKTFYVAAASALSLVLSLGFWMGEDSFNHVEPDLDQEQVEQPQNLDFDQPVMSGPLVKMIGLNHLENMPWMVLIIQMEARLLSSTLTPLLHPQRKLKARGSGSFSLINLF